MPLAQFIFCAFCFFFYFANFASHLRETPTFGQKKRPFCLSNSSYFARVLFSTMLLLLRLAYARRLLWRVPRPKRQPRRVATSLQKWRLAYARRSFSGFADSQSICYICVSPTRDATFCGSPTIQILEISPQASQSSPRALGSRPRPLTAARRLLTAAAGRSERPQPLRAAPGFSEQPQPLKAARRLLGAAQGLLRAAPALSEQHQSPNPTARSVFTC